MSSGPSLQLHLLVQERANEPTPELIATFQAGLRLTPNLPARLPLLSLNGRLNPHGTSVLHVATNSSWHPWPSLIPQLHIPRLNGSFTLDSAGPYAVEVSDPAHILPIFMALYTSGAPSPHTLHMRVHVSILYITLPKRAPIPGDS